MIYTQQQCFIAGCLCNEYCRYKMCGGWCKPTRIHPSTYRHAFGWGDKAKAPSIWGIPLSPEQYTFVEAESTWRRSHTIGAHLINRYYSCTLIISFYLQHLKGEETKQLMTNASDKYFHF